MKSNKRHKRRKRLSTASLLNKLLRPKNVRSFQRPKIRKWLLKTAVSQAQMMIVIVVMEVGRVTPVIARMIEMANRRKNEEARGALGQPVPAQMATVDQMLQRRQPSGPRRRKRLRHRFFTRTRRSTWACPSQRMKFLASH